MCEQRKGLLVQVVQTGEVARDRGPRVNPAAQAAAGFEALAVTATEVLLRGKRCRPARGGLAHGGGAAETAGLTVSGHGHPAFGSHRRPVGGSPLRQDPLPAERQRLRRVRRRFAVLGECCQRRRVQRTSACEATVHVT